MEETSRRFEKGVNRNLQDGEYEAKNCRDLVLIENGGTTW
ncbi:hypothetical protein BN3660_02955 [Eubacteriaceae bacterium CHKCI004]|nr:hypothetical protein BN3660_02955 [Eubacteriaceae bacterium CHKCI004]